MNPLSHISFRELSLFAILSLHTLVEISSAQAEPPLGVIIYKSSQYSSPEKAVAAEYTTIRPSSVVINGVFSNAKDFQIMRNLVVEIIPYPDLNSGKVRSSEEIQKLLEVRAKLTHATIAYPLTKTIIQPRINSLDELTQKLNAERASPPEMQQQTPIGQNSLPQNPSPPASKSIVFSLTRLDGKVIEYSRVVKVQGDTIQLMKPSGLESVRFSDLTDDAVSKLRRDPIVNNALLEIEERNKAEHQEQLKERQEITKKFDEFLLLKEAAKADAESIQEIEKLRRLIESGSATESNWRDALGSASYEKLLEILPNPDRAEFTSIKFRSRLLDQLAETGNRTAIQMADDSEFSIDAVEVTYFTGVLNPITGKREALKFWGVPNLDAVYKFSPESDNTGNKFAPTDRFSSIISLYRFYLENGGPEYGLQKLFDKLDNL